MDSCFEVTISVQKDGDGYYAFCPGLPGVFACGATVDEAIKNAKDGATSILKSKIRFNDSIEENEFLKRVTSNIKHRCTEEKLYSRQFINTALFA